jgi:hypothetical protein
VAEREISLDAEDLLRRLGLAIKRINELEARKPFEFLHPRFIEAMSDIGRYGFEKYGDDSFEARRLKGDSSRGELARTRPYQIAEHAEAHFDMYLRGIPHDHFNTRRHQLAAVAFNAMMEFYFAGLESE